MKNSITKFCCFTWLLIAPKISALPTASDEIGKLLNDIRSMQATFEQTLSNQKGKKTGATITGSMMLERPGKFRWQITKPNNQLIIVNKNSSILFDIDLEQATKRNVDYKQPGNPAMLLSGSIESIKKSFSVKKLNNLQFELKPKNQGNAYQKITLQFVGGRPSAMYIIDNLDQKTSIIFKNIKLNPKIPAKMFVFNPPSNIEILDAN